MKTQFDLRCVVLSNAIWPQVCCVEQRNLTAGVLCWATQFDLRCVVLSNAIWPQVCCVEQLGCSLGNMLTQSTSLPIKCVRVPIASFCSSDLTHSVHLTNITQQYTIIRCLHVHGHDTPHCNDYTVLLHGVSWIDGRRCRLWAVPHKQASYVQIKIISRTLALLGEPSLCRQCVILWGSLGTEVTTGY